MVQTAAEDLTAPLTVLRKMRLFQSFSEDDMLALSERVRLRHIGQGDTIFHQGDSGTSRRMRKVSRRSS